MLTEKKKNIKVRRTTQLHKHARNGRCCAPGFSLLFCLSFVFSLFFVQQNKALRVLNSSYCLKLLFSLLYCVASCAFCLCFSFFSFMQVEETPVPVVSIG